MKYCHVFLVIMCSFALAASDIHAQRYYSEFLDFKNLPQNQLMFNEDAHQGLAMIQRDIISCKNLTPSGRFIRMTFEALDGVLVTSESMPLLYAYVDGICKKANITTPTIYITRQDGFFNAMAQKLLKSSGGIIIGQKLMKELSDDALEGVVAHEVGHIKHNHINKLLALGAFRRLIQLGLMYAAAQYIPIQLVEQWSFLGNDEVIYLVESTRYNYYAMGAIGIVTGCITSLIPEFIINKRFEKEADLFACDNDKAKGLIEFFELLIKKEQLQEEEFTTIYNLLLQNKEKLDSGDYNGLLFNYYAVWAAHRVHRALYYKTFWGPHPSNEARIEAAKKYVK
jgi:Zn-dependent protease with chaperone function